MSRVVPQPMLDAMGGSTGDVGMLFNGWYDGQLVAQDLDVSNWSIKWTGDRNTQIQGKLSLTVNDQTGQLAPWALDDTLSAAGQEIQVFMRSASYYVPIGRYAISETAPTEEWRIAGDGITWVSGGSQIALQADDLTLLVADSKFMAAEQPPSSSTAMGELKRILTNIIPVTFDADVVDVNLPSTLTYSTDRIGAVSDLCRLLNCGFRMDGAGQLNVFTWTQKTAVFSLQGGPGNNLVRVNRKQRRADLFNAAVSRSTQAKPEIVGYAYVTAGALRFDGPLKRKPTEHNAIAATQDGVNADAATTLSTAAQLAAQTLQIFCLPRADIMIGDWVNIAHPTISGKTFSLNGLVTGVVLSGDKNGFAPMELAVQVDPAALKQVAVYLHQGGFVT